MVYTLTVVRRAVRQGSTPQMSPTWAASTGTPPHLGAAANGGRPAPLRGVECTEFCWEKICILFLGKSISASRQTQLSQRRRGVIKAPYLTPRGTD